MKEEIRKVSKGKNQSRVTLPKSWKSEYVIVRPLINKIKDVRREYEKFTKR